MGCGQAFFAVAQRDLEGCEWKEFHHANGLISSEGCFVEGLPTGIWKSYNPDGMLISEGERKNNQPHGQWRFYENDLLTEEATFHLGVREGIQVLWMEGIATDTLDWVQGQKSGWHTSFRADGSIKSMIPYVNNKREGKGTMFNQQSQLHGFRWYKNDRLVASESFNRFDEKGRKTGLWKTFHSTGRLVESGYYKEGLKHGMFQFFDAKGTVTRLVEYNMGVEVVKEEGVIPEVRIEEMRREDGSVYETVTYVGGLKQGISRVYDADGNVVNGAVFEKDKLIAEGVTTVQGERHGPWKEYWPSGALRSEGTYEHDLKVGLWIFYRESGEKEQQGSFDRGLNDGEWTWWFPGGELHREERYKRGKLEGMYTEWDSRGNVVVEGRYENNLREGFWHDQVNDYFEEGEYVAGEKEGVWVMWYNPNQKQGEGEYSVGLAVGKHKQWHRNGLLREEGWYEDGLKHKKWRTYDDTGSMLHEYLYKYGTLVKLDGSRVDKGVKAGNNSN